ncbi:MAG: hypothetical protein O6952_08315, partial [Planctomycetota bacterium]|nr:hypothetical protein [Planctomycetota bacterium]
MPVRPEGALAFGTIGCIADRDGVPYLVTCDHVINSFPPRAEVRVELYPRHDISLQEPIALYDGLTLALPPAHMADLAAAPISNPNVSDPARLPAEIPGGGPRRLSGVVEPAVGMDVFFWGARSAGYQRGIIVAPRSEERLPHPG